jgi:hypothetical protein
VSARVPPARHRRNHLAIVEAAARAAGIPPAFVAVKPWQLRLVGAVNPGARETVEMLYEFERDFVVDSSAFQTHFGQPPTPLDRALAETVSWYRRAARTIGITRWLSAAFPLAEQWQETTSATSREALAIQFDTLNNFGGAVGETLGVSIFAAVWLGATIARPGLPRWARVTGALVLVPLTAPAIELAGVDGGILVSLSSSAITIWLLAVGIAMMRDRPAGRPVPSPSTVTEMPAVCRIAL